MDNQQETVSLFQIGWLCGIVDGEGCFTISHGGNGGYSPSFKLVNTDDEIIDQFAKILDSLTMGHHIYDAWRTKNQRPAKRLEVNGVLRLKKFLDFFCPYFQAKRDQAKILLEWIDLRLSVPQRTPTMPEEYVIYKTLQAMKKI